MVSGCISKISPKVIYFIIIIPDFLISCLRLDRIDQAEVKIILFLKWVQKLLLLSANLSTTLFSHFQWLLLFFHLHLQLYKLLQLPLVAQQFLGYALSHESALHDTCVELIRLGLVLLGQTVHHGCQDVPIDAFGLHIVAAVLHVLADQVDLATYTKRTINWQLGSDVINHLSLKLLKLICNVHHLSI